MKTAIAVILSIVCTSPALAQGGGGGGGGGMGGMDRNRGVRWADNLGEAVSRANAEQKFVLFYVYPVTEAQVPPAFNNADIIGASGGNWVFAKQAFEREDATFKRMKVTSAPTVLGLDRYGNMFVKLPGAGADAIRGVLRSTPDQIEIYKRDLASDSQKARAALQAGDDARALKLFLEICSSGRVGYPDIEEAFGKVREIGDKRLAAADAKVKMDPTGAIKSYQQIVTDFGDTPVAADAQLRLARAEFEEDNIPAALAHVARLRATVDERLKVQRESAGKLLDEIAADGAQRVDRALKLAAAGEKEQAKAALRKVQTDYKGTDAVRRATEALKTLD